MPTKQLSMRKTREILRLKWVLGRSHREITNTLAVGLGTITQVVMRAERMLRLLAVSTPAIFENKPS